MFRRLLKTGFTSSALLPTEIFSQDNVSQATETEKNANISSVQDETGWERIQRMYIPDEFGEVSQELVTVLHVGSMSFFVGCIYGGVLHSRVAYMDFIKNNQATAFNDHFEAKKKLQDKVSISFGKGAWKWAWRLSLFSTSFVGISTTISVFRGKSGILEYVAAGFFSGAMYKFSMGPRGWLVGGGLGSVLGLIAGCSTTALLSLSGMSMDEVRYWQYHWRKERTDHFNKGIATYLKNEEDQVLKLHDEQLGKVQGLENLEK